MFYRNDSKVDPYPLQLPGCSLDCPLEDFVRITKLSISDDRHKECQLPSEGNNKSEIFTYTHTLFHSSSVSSIHPCFLLFLVLCFLLSLSLQWWPSSGRCAAVSSSSSSSSSGSFIGLESQGESEDTTMWPTKRLEFWQQSKLLVRTPPGLVSCDSRDDDEL